MNVRMQERERERMLDIQNVRQNAGIDRTLEQSIER